MLATDAVVQAAVATSYLADYEEAKRDGDRDALARVFARSMLALFDSNVALSWSLYSLGNEFSAVAPRIERFQDHIAPNVHALVHYVTFDKFRQTYNAVVHKAIPQDQQQWGELTGEDYTWEKSRSSLDITERHIVEHIAVAQAAWLEEPIISFEHAEELRIRLEQELCRAYDRRLVAGRVCAYPEDREEEDDSSAEEARWDNPTEARNKWLYEQCLEIVPYASIIRELGKNPEWAPIWSPSGIKRAANAYASRKKLRPIPRRQSGRPSR
jgi:hypothetical protein